ncbi:MAG: GNAT family N-acetyltransferase, partial [Candidatus Atribacteria bacterium]
MRMEVIYNSLPDHALAAAWESYISSHPRGNIFQSCGFYRMWFHTPYHEPLAIIAFDDSESVCGIIQGVIIREPGFFMRHLTPRAIAWGGPLANDKAIALELLARYEQILGRRVIYSQIRPVGEQHFPDVFSDCGFKSVPHLDIINDLSGGEEMMLSLIHKERRRNIGRARSKGVTVRVTDNEKEINGAVSLILDLYRRIGLPAPPEQMLTCGKQFLGEALKVFIAEVGGKIAGARIVLCYRDMVYDWYAGSDPKLQNKYVNDILPWEV